MNFRFSGSFWFLLSFFVLAACSSNEGAGPPRLPPGFHNDAVKVKNIQNSNSDLIEKALAYMEDDRVYEAHGFTPSQCSATPYNYSLFKRDGEIHINQKIHFMGEERLKPKLEPCLKQAKSFYSSHGLNYEIEKLSSSDEADFSVQLIPGEGRSNAVEWYEGDIVNCSVVIHEIGHLLGLPDEYHEEFTCREEKFSALEFNPFSFMEYSSSQTLVNLFLLPRHMLAILDQAIPSTLSFIVPESGTIGSKLPSCQSVSQVGESDFFFNFTYEPLSLYRAEVGFCRT